MCSPESRIFYNKFSRLAFRDARGHEAGEVQTSDIQNDSMYLCPVTIGEGAGAVTVHLDFDTGSSDLWGTFLNHLISYESFLPNWGKTPAQTIQFTILRTLPQPNSRMARLGLFPMVTVLRRRGMSIL